MKSVEKKFDDKLVQIIASLETFAYDEQGVISFLNRMTGTVRNIELSFSEIIVLRDLVRHLLHIRNEGVN